MMKRDGNIQGNSNKKWDKSYDENTRSALEGKEEYGKENDSSNEELVLPIMITEQDNYKKPCSC